MIRPLLILSMFAALPLEGAEPIRRVWTDRNGRHFEATMVACDGLRATLLLEGRSPVAIPFTSLGVPDLAFAREWRKEHPEFPLIVPKHMPPWPAESAAQNLEVTLAAAPGSNRHGYESAHFSVESDVKLPVSVVRDIVAVLEGTREAVIAMPLGLMTGWAPGKYRVALFGDTNAYAQAGGPPGTGGVYEPRSRRMLILLPNLGIKLSSNGIGSSSFDHRKNAFILKHEVTHQLLHPWRPDLPVWLDEGFSECIAALPSNLDRFRFVNLDHSMRDYLHKWQTNRSKHSVTLIRPARLLTIDRREWDAAIADQAAYHWYNSAALLAFYFLRHDPPGNGLPLASFFNAVRDGADSRDAEKEFLLRDRTPESLDRELEQLARKMGLSIEWN